VKEEGTDFELGNDWVENNHDCSSPSADGNGATREELGIKRRRKGVEGLVIWSKEKEDFLSSSIKVTEITKEKGVHKRMY
jgi:hypothetical protein